MGELDDLRQQVQEIHAVVRAPHADKRWYERSPGKEVVAHVVTLALAGSVGVAVHLTTGAPVVIEAKAVPAAAEPPTTYAAAPALPAASAVATAEVQSEPVAADLPPSQPKVPVRRDQPVHAPPLELAAAPAHAAAAPAAGVPAQTAPAHRPRAAASAAGSMTFDEIQVRGQP